MIPFYHNMFRKYFTNRRDVHTLFHWIFTTLREFIKLSEILPIGQMNELRRRKLVLAELLSWV